MSLPKRNKILEDSDSSFQIKLSSKEGTSESYSDSGIFFIMSFLTSL